MRKWFKKSLKINSTFLLSVICVFVFDVELKLVSATMTLKFNNHEKEIFIVNKRVALNFQDDSFVL